MSAGAAHLVSSAVPLRINPRQTEEGKASGSRSTWAVEFTPTPQLAEKGVNINGIRARLQEIGVISRSTPQVKAEGEISFHFLVETTQDLPTLQDWGSIGVLVTKAEDRAAP